jgi:hypothetical protein
MALHTIKVVCFSNKTMVGNQPKVSIVDTVMVSPNSMFRFPEGTYFWCYLPFTDGKKDPDTISYYDLNLKEQALMDTGVLCFHRVYGDSERYCTLEVGDYKGEELDALKNRFYKYSDWDREYTVEPYVDEDDDLDETMFYRALLNEGKGYLSRREIKAVQRHRREKK